ncbi:hypothetical protein MKEN_00699100 [Mycena kentingensis (nom. inval.)]|nr:hypothetical protein MKEN_00699100 [Mycena kentingensis (nom. inval.)]
MPNLTGKNGYGKKSYPPDDILTQKLTQYAIDGLSQEEKILALATDKDCLLQIRTTTLNKLERRLKIPGVRRDRRAPEVETQDILDEVEKNPAQTNGPNFIKTKLQLQKKFIPRDTIRRTMAVHYPLGPQIRYPGRRTGRVHRTPLSALGPFHEVCSDGHEKLGAQALRMGRVDLPIYAWKDKWTGELLKMDVVPNSRTNAAIGHLYLDFVDELGGISLQNTTDKGSEIGWLLAMQTVLREKFAPEIDLAVYPAHVSVKSVHNTIIEAFWRWLREKLGLDLRDHILRGKVEHIFDITSPLHLALFNWIFPPLIQAALDDFRIYWNHHRIRRQNNKNMPSGHVPSVVMRNPHLYGGINCFVKVPKADIDELRLMLMEEVGPRCDHLSWVDGDFAAAAAGVHTALGAPKITLENAWDVFTKMMSALS